MRIAIYGANGYQGRLVAAEGVRRGLPVTLIGRHRGRLESAATSLGLAGPDLRVAGDRESLADALRDLPVVVNCAGPFTEVGRFVAEAAIDAGCHYVDTAGEQLFLHDLFSSLHTRAEQAGVAVVPSATDSALPGDLLAHLLADGRGEVEEMVFGYRVTGADAPSRGTVRSAMGSLEVLRSGGLGFDDGTWRRDMVPLRTSIAFGSAPAVEVVRFPLQEVVTVPRHVRVRRAQGFVDPSLGEALTSRIPPEVVASLPDGPEESVRRRARFALAIEAVWSDGERRSGLVEGWDTYGSTAITAVEAARRLGDRGGAGVLAPSQAFDPRDFLDWLASNSTIRVS